MKPKNTDVDQAILAYKADLKGSFEGEIAKLEALQSSIDSKIGLLDTIEKFNAEKATASEVLSKQAKDLEILKQSIESDKSIRIQHQEELRLMELKIKARDRTSLQRESAVKEAESQLQEAKELHEKAVAHYVAQSNDRVSAMNARTLVLDKREARMRELAAEIAKL